MGNKAWETLRSFQEEFTKSVINGDINSYDDIIEAIENDVENACIYTSDCYDILQELSVSNFDDCIANFGEVTSISQLAWYYLREYMMEELDLSGMEEAINLIEEYKDTVAEYQELQQSMLDLGEELVTADEEESESINESIEELQEEIDGLKEKINELEDDLNRLDIEIDVEDVA